MNITHATREEYTGCKLQVIFNRQRELMEKYHHIEEKSGLCQTNDVPVNLDDKRGQARIKDFAWRLTEEMGEALDAMESDHDMEHGYEELIDGLHFLTELSILAGFDEYLFIISNNKEDSLDVLLKLGNDTSLIMGLAPLPDHGESHFVGQMVQVIVRELGMTCNTLKNKPWKQSHMRTDKVEFEKRLFNTWIAYIHLLSHFLTTEEITDIYLKKSQVNKFRQRSNY